MDDSALHERIRLTVDRFLLSENTSHEAKEVLLQYAEARPDRANPDPIIPMDEIEMRLELIAKVQRTNDTSSTDITQSNIDGHFQFTVLQLSYLMLIPISFLRDLSQMSWVYLQPYLNLDTYLSFMVRGRMPGDSSTGTRTASRTSLDSSQRATSTRGIPRDMKERDQCVARDGGACILTGAAYPEVCHIIPFAISASEASISQYRHHRTITVSFLSEDAAQQSTGLLGLGPGCSDKSWNMLCLHPTLHDWWGKCLFGLKCLGILPSFTQDGSCIIKLQFYWMPRNGNNPREYTEPDSDVVRRMLQTISREQDRGFITEARKDCSRLLETGHVFSLVTPEEDAAKMKIMVDIQWANTQLAAISGSTGIWELLGESSGKPDIAYERVEAWLDSPTLGM